MKTIHHKILPITMGVFATLPVFAIEPPVDDAPPPPSIKSPATTPVEDSPAPRVTAPESKSAFIGLITAEIPEMLGVHIGVKPGEGVLIRELAPGGPAEKAGFVRHDVIVRVAGKPVGSPVELSAQISALKPDEEIAVDLIHEGKPASKNVKLEVRPAENGRVDRPDQLGHLDFDNMPEAQAERLRNMIERRLNGLIREPDNLPETPKRGGGNFRFKSDATFRLMDNDGSVEMKSSDDSKEVTVRDHDNTVVWSGPWDTEQDKAAAPPAIRERIERFKFDEGFRGGGFRFRMGPQGPKDEE